MNEPMEPVLEPGLRIVDAHHHLMDGPGHRYTIDDYAADCALGHDIRASVYIEVRQHYRDAGPEHLRPVGETEFVASLAARAEQGAWGGRRLCAGIVGYADLAVGDRAGEVLDAHIEAGGGRFKGIRRGVYWDADEAVYGHIGMRPPPGLLLDAEFARGFRQLHARGLSFDAVLFHPQLPELADLARRFPDTPIILNHLGFRLGVGRHALDPAGATEQWRRGLAAVAECPNVLMKGGGFGIRLWGFDIAEGERPPSGRAGGTLAAVLRDRAGTLRDRARHPRKQLPRGRADDDLHGPLERPQAPDGRMFRRREAPALPGERQPGLQARPGDVSAAYAPTRFPLSVVASYSRRKMPRSCRTGTTRSTKSS